jgi:hypothetical protein
MAELRLLAEGHGNVAPDISLTIDSQQSAHNMDTFHEGWFKTSFLAPVAPKFASEVLNRLAG